MDAMVSADQLRVAVGRRVPAGHEVLELPLDVGEQRARAEAEQIRPEPAVAQLFLDQRQPVERLAWPCGCRPRA